MVDNKPDTDAPPWCTCQRRDALGPYVPCHLHDVTSDAPQEGRPTGCSECTDWFTNPLNPQPVDEAHPWCPIRDTACVRFPDAVRPEGRPTTPQTEASRCFWRGRQTGCECHAIIEAAAGALPSVPCSTCGAKVPLTTCHDCHWKIVNALHPAAPTEASDAGT
jgi:hypothetical protein